MIGNRIIDGIISEFKNDFELHKHNESKVFEYLINYLVISKIHPESFADPTTLEEVDIDKKNTFGIDAFALVVNDNLVLNKDEISLYRKSKRLNVKFIFIQSKTSSSVDSGDLLKFTQAVKNFFSSSPDIPISDELQSCKELVDEIFSTENTRYFGSSKPVCELYYAVTGKPLSDPTVEGVMKSEESSILLSVPELKSATIKLINSDYIIDSYNEIENRYSVIINFKNNISFEKISNVTQSYIGYLSSNEFLKLICDYEDNLRRNLFYENVRDFQGLDNSVNQEIENTIKNQEDIDKFVLLNNGITIVARDFKSLGSNEFEISDYYVVNGCQTSNMLYHNRSIIKNSKKLWVPIKIIHTTSSDLTSQIIRATNRQSPVPDEAFVSLEKFHKRLQDFYNYFSEKVSDKLLYERRSKEYTNTIDRIEKSRLVNLHGQIRSFGAIILGEPQLIYSRSPVTILKDHRDKLFVDEHKYLPYFLSSYFLYKFYKKRNAGFIDGKYIVFRYHLGWIYRMLSAREISLPPLNSKKIDTICERIISEFDRDSEFEQRLNHTITILEDAKKKHKQESGYLRNRELVRRKSFKELILKTTKSQLG
ncbi:MAG: AIPR family protein [Candidatus Electrothrix sp. LOE1_4_5]|nr:AIPR family protein [Candidatus Electrothrix gigas]